MSHLFLSEAWIEAAREIRARHDDRIPPVPQAIRINQIITEVPFGEGTVRSYFDTSSGRMELELGELDAADATVTTDYSTARALFVDQDPTVAMQAFMSGKIKVQGDMMKIMAMQSVMQMSLPEDADAQQIAAAIADEIKAITAS